MVDVDINKICICLENLSNQNEAIRNEATDYLESGEKNFDFPFIL